MKILAWIAPFTLALSMSACHEHEIPECEEIAELCHPFDKGSGVPHECHELAHNGGTKESCTAKRDECVAACSAVDMSVVGDMASKG